MTNNISANQSVNKKKLSLTTKIIAIHILFLIVIAITYFFREKLIINGYSFKFQSIFIMLSLLVVLIRLYLSLGLSNFFSNTKKLVSCNKENPFYIFWHDRVRVTYLLLFLLPFFIPLVLIDNFVDKIISQIFQNSNIVVFSVILIFIIIGFSIIGYIKSKEVYIPSKTNLNLLFLISAWTAYYDSTSKYEYLTFFNSDVIRFTFFIYTVTYLNLHFYLKSKYDNAEKLKKSSNDAPYLLTDEEIGKEGIDDNLGRKEYAHRLVEVLLIGKFQTSFAVGITGEWGSGKTSFISLMKKKLDDKKEDILIVEFNPWNSQTSSQIIEDFFGVFQKILSPYSSTISSEIIKYAKNLIHSNKSHWWILPQQIINYFDKPISIQDRFSHINEKLKIIDKKIFVIIDDLDRLDKEEIIEVIRLIRNTANFYNTCFIVGYDKGYVTEAIKGINDYRSKYYLEKIFQLEIVLPHVENDFYVKELINKIESRIGKQEAKELKLLIKNRTTKISFDNFYIIISSLIDSYRDINRFINILTINYQEVEDDVFFVHFILIEALRYKYPLVIDTMYKQTNELFSFDNDSVKLNNHNAEKNTLTFRISEIEFKTLKDEIQKNINTTSSPHFHQIFDKYVKEESVDSTLNNFLSEFTLSITDKNIIKLFFELLFGEKSKTKVRSLNHPNYYFNYFSFRIAKDAISIIEFNMLVKGNNVEKLKEKVDEWLNLAKKNLEDCFYNYLPTDYETYKTYILVFLYASEKMSFTNRMDRVLNDKLPDLKFDDNKNRLKNFFNKEFIESAQYPFVQELKYLNNLKKIHFDEFNYRSNYLLNSGYDEELASRHLEYVIENEGIDFSDIRLFSIIDSSYIKKFIEKAGKIEDLDSEEFKSFFGQVAGDKGWFNYVGRYGDANLKTELQNILKAFIEKHTEVDVKKILLEGIEEEDEVINNKAIKIPVQGSPYTGICSLFENYNEFDVFLKKIKHNEKMSNEKLIREAYSMYCNNN